MVSKPLRIFTFLFSAFLVLAFTAGVTHAASQFLSQNVRSNNHQVAMAEAGSTIEPSPTTAPSNTPAPSLTSEPTRQSPSKVEFSSVLTAINLEWWTIGSYVVQVTADTEIEGQPVIGDRVSVEAFLQPDGTYIAHEISTHSGQMEENDSHFGPSMTGTPETHDSFSGQSRHSGGQEMHDGDHEDDDHDHGSGPGSDEDEHDHDKGGSHEHNGDD